MFIENYRQEALIGGQARTLIPYPRISEDDWAKWKAFLPVKSMLICKRELLGRRESFLQAAYGVPPDVCHEMVRGARHFEEVEVWGKREIRKDPIAVGLTADGERYLICRWGVDKLIPFEIIKSRSCLYQIENAAVTMLASEKFWLSTLAAAILGIAYIGTW